jgi:hypothetical protein
MSKLILITLGVRPMGFVGVDALTGVKSCFRPFVEIDKLTWTRDLVDLVEAEFERAVFFLFSPCFASGSIIKKRMSPGSINFSVKPLGC